MRVQPISQYFCCSSWRRKIYQTEIIIKWWIFKALFSYFEYMVILRCFIWKWATLDLLQFMHSLHFNISFKYYWALRPCRPHSVQLTLCRLRKEEHSILQQYRWKLRRAVSASDYFPVFRFTAKLVGTIVI